MRPWVEALYAVPPEQVIGSSIKVKYELREGEPVLRCLPEIDFIDDKAGKPLGIHKFIGLRPIAAFGNSDGDLQMLQWTAAGDRSRFMLLVHHTDAEREYAQDRKSHVGKLDQAGLQTIRQRTIEARRFAMNKMLLPMMLCLSCVPVAQAVDYQQLGESVDTDKAAESVDKDKMGEAVSTEGVDYQKAYDAVDKEKAADSVDVDKAREALTK